MQVLFKFCLFICSLLLTCSCLAAEDFSLQEFVRQEQRSESLLEQQSQERLTVLAPNTETKKNLFDHIFIYEKQCFNLQKIDFNILNNFDDKTKARHTEKLKVRFKEIDRELKNRCVGTQSLKNLIRYMQNELMKDGYVTSFLNLPDQDLKTGVLIFEIRFGQINKIVNNSNKILSDLQIKMALPTKKNKILKVQDLDQGLENLKNNLKLDVKIELIPSESDELIGFSDVRITAQPFEKINTSISVDDSGSETTGKYIANLNLGINNLLSLNDILNVNYAHSIDNLNENKNESIAANYNLPLQYFQLVVSFNQYNYEQTVAGFNSPIIYSGISRQGNISLSKVISRTTNYKTSLYGKMYRKKNQNFIEDIEIGVQRRQTAGWNIGLDHTHYIGNATIDAGIDYKRGTGAFGAMPAPEEQIVDIFGNRLPVEGYARAPIWSADLRYSHPFMVGNNALQYRVNWRGQYAEKILVPQDRFYIGGRYTVRGFDGKISLGGDNGHYLQQEIAVNGLLHNSQLYTAIDQGWVNGRNSFKGQRYLMGSVLGLRTQYEGFYLDGFLGYGLIAPKSVPKQFVSGFSFNYSF